MIDVERLTKRYDAHEAVRGVSFSVEKGQIVGFLGPNGAGKSTTMRILAGYLPLTSGRVRIGGHDIAESPDAAKALIGYMPEAVPLYPEMRVVEYLRFRAELKAVPRAQRSGNIDEAMSRAKVVDVANATIGNLSKGYRQRVGLADALVARPPLLILDEPTAGLDPNQIREVRAVLTSLGADYTVLLSTHILSEVEATCSRAIVIDRGRVLSQGTLEDMRAEHAARRLRLVARAERSKVTKALGTLSAVEVVSMQESAGVTTAVLAVGEHVSPEALAEISEQVAKALAQHEVPLRELGALNTSLEDVFARLTRASDDGATDVEEASAQVSLP
jgi:ABC-2 type transport system ATP-binding protein